MSVLGKWMLRWLAREAKSAKASGASIEFPAALPAPGQTVGAAPEVDEFIAYPPDPPDPDEPDEWKPPKKLYVVVREDRIEVGENGLRPQVTVTTKSNGMPVFTHDDPGGAALQFEMVVATKDLEKATRLARSRIVPFLRAALEAVEKENQNVS